ncbi:ParB/RepB/Spo0J family partition protein [Dyella acidisoli]|uniref:ParB-like N-terminal domain-containing protein n=1 Tax=Dyella acidisoli TaxID=1867834 RepID=A0ABQ5XTN6_9GAMM|nr:ParB/RepB/Spo0J family partition protein [Dyella acidisoli]GLQ95246.1 hypothetical protein GCM10007901_42010 [Dyella acidisoli]
MTIEQALQRLQVAKVRHVPLTELKTDEALQPRDPRMVPYREKDRIKNRSEERIGGLLLALKASRDVQLEPLLAADIDGQLLVVDGHHRLVAYQRAKRETIPVRVMPMDHQRAVLISKLVNCSGRALEMHPEQQRDAAWQYLAAITEPGTAKLPKGESRRSVSGRFGVSVGTIHRMLHKLPDVNPKDWHPDALDPGTNFPRWRYVRDAGAGWQDMREKMTAEQHIQHEAEKLARKIGALMDKASSQEVVRFAMTILEVERKLEAANQDTRDFVEETAETYENDDF